MSRTKHKWTAVAAAVVASDCVYLSFKLLSKLFIYLFIFLRKGWLVETEDDGLQE